MENMLSFLTCNKYLRPCENQFYDKMPSVRHLRGMFELEQDSSNNFRLNILRLVNYWLLFPLI